MTGLTCSFCGKDQDEVDLMVYTQGPNICDACIALCEDIRREHRISKIWQRALEESFGELWGTDV
jgi:ATP-dependent protease Clp ATPase subunit